MIDTLRTLAQPYSHWLMSHRDTTIIVMGLVLMWAAGQALLTRWRNERLHRDLAATRTDSRTVMRRDYTLAGEPPARAAASEPESATGLPPIRGGRTYARNLGTALQKAGMAPTPVYSPPNPTGWGPGPGPTPGRGTPPSPPPYAVPTPPWASPAQPGQPSGPRPMPAPPAGSPWPTYVPPAGPGQPPAQAPQPAPPFFAGGPGSVGPVYAQPPSPPPGHYAMPGPPTTLPPAAPTPLGGVPLSEPVPPPLPNYPPASPPVQAVSAPAAAQPAPSKPKRRRFSLQVLQNLEQTLQRTTGLGAPSKVAEPPVPPSPVAPATGPAAPLFAAAAAPSAEPAAPPAPAADETAISAPEAEETPTAAAEPAPPAWKAAESPGSDARAAMRAMLFGEDEKRAPKGGRAKPAPLGEPEPEPDEPVFRFEPVTVEPSAPTEQPASTEEAAPSSETIEAAAEVVEAPAEAAEPVGSHWGDEPPAETAEAFELTAAPAAADEPEPATAEPAFDTTAAEPATARPVGGAPVTTPAPTGGDRGKLVIIEDDTGVAEYYATLFRGNGFDVHVASDGVAGVDLCTRVQPNVILLDVMMPRQNGMLVLQTLRASDETRETPVVVLSNFSEPTLIKRALQLGALEYVIKTQVDGAALLEAVPHWMNREKAFAAA